MANIAISGGGIKRGGLQGLIDKYEGSSGQEKVVALESIKKSLLSQGLDADQINVGVATLIKTAKSALSQSSGARGGTGSLSQSIQEQFEKANAANEARYAAIRGGESDIDAAQGGYKGLRDRSLGYVDAISNQQEQDAERQAQQRSSAVKQGLYSAGMSGTTVAPTLQMGQDRERDAEIRRIQDAKMQQRLGTDIGTTGEGLRFMERREDVAPQYGMYAQMLQNQAQYGGVGGSGGGGGGAFSGGYTVQGFGGTGKLTGGLTGESSRTSMPQGSTTGVIADRQRFLNWEQGLTDRNTGVGGVGAHYSPQSNVPQSGYSTASYYPSSWNTTQLGGTGGLKDRRMASYMPLH